MPVHTRPPRRRGRRAAEAAEPLFAGFELADFNPAYLLTAAVIVALSLAPVGLMAVLRPGSAASSWLLATGIYIPCLIFAGMTLVFGRATPVKSRLVALGLAAGGLAFAVWGGLTDYEQRATTLIELEVEGSTGAAGAVPREVVFDVEHPGVEHTLHFWPVHGPAGASETALLRVELRDGEGATVLRLEEPFEPRAQSDGPDRWGAASRAFTPEGPGRHTLVVTPLTGNVPAVHIRVEDPLKRDGQRMPGY